MRPALQNLDLVAFLFLAPLLLHGQQTVRESARLDLRHGVPLVQVFLNHRGPFTFVVDTGTTSSAIVSSNVASKLGLKTEGKEAITDLQGGPGRLLDYGILESLEIAGVEFKAVPAIFNQFPGSARHYDGIVGLQLFRDYLLTIDLHRRQLQVTAGRLSMVDPNVISFRMDIGIPTIMLRVQGYEVEGAIDTGAPGLIIPESLAKRLTFVQSPTIIGLDETQVGQFQVKGGRMEGDIGFATFNFEKPYIGISSAFWISDLGAETFMDFSLTIDQRNQLVRFSSEKPTHSFGNPSKPKELQLPADTLMKTVMRTGAP